MPRFVDLASTSVSILPAHRRSDAWEQVSPSAFSGQIPADSPANLAARLFVTGGSGAIDQVVNRFGWIDGIPAARFACRSPGSAPNPLHAGSSSLTPILLVISNFSIPRDGFLSPSHPTRKDRVPCSPPSRFRPPGPPLDPRTVKPLWLSKRVGSPAAARWPKGSPVAGRPTTAVYPPAASSQISERARRRASRLSLVFHRTIESLWSAGEFGEAMTIFREHKADLARRAEGRLGSN